MPEYSIDFESFKWEDVADGKRQKIFNVGQDRIRIVELSNGYKETNWCSKRHIGYITDGTVTLEFEDKEIVLTKGQGLYISGGEKSKHKAFVAPNSSATMILFEEA